MRWGPRDGRILPIKLAYGFFSLHDCFALVDGEWAQAAADEIDAIAACSTVGEVRQVARHVRCLWIPDSVDEDELPDDEPFDWRSTASAQDGDWPPMPDQYALDWLPDEVYARLAEEAAAEQIETTLNGPYLALPLEKETQIVAVIRDFGAEIRRDDHLISRLALWT